MRTVSSIILAARRLLDGPPLIGCTHRFLDVLTVTDADAQFGGQFTLGGSNSSLYTGDIEFIDIPAGREGFWTLEMTGAFSHSIFAILG